MFSKFKFKEDVTTRTQVKSSIQRAIKAEILERYPLFNQVVEDIFPKKVPLIMLKCKDHINLVSVNGVVLFYQFHDGPWFPSLKLVHKYPEALPQLKVDKGAIPFILSGAHIMCPGLTSKNAEMNVDLPAGGIAAIMAEGKENAVAIGQLKMSTDDIRKINKGIGVDNVHHLADPLWKNLVVD